MQIDELKARFSITRAWADLGLRGKPGRCVASPLREDAHPSFSVWPAADGQERFKDHATGDSGDVVDFVKLARGCDTKAALEFIERQLGLARPEPKPTPAARAKSRIPPLRPGTAADHQRLIEQRGFSADGLALAEQRRLLHFGALWGTPAWAITDQRRALVELRRLDGQRWPAFGSLSERKAHCVGTGKDWPVGTLESRPFPRICWVEGAPDVVAGHHFVAAEGKQDRVAVVGVLGAANRRLAPEALNHFAGKTVLMFPHADGAGQQAARAWAEQLHQAGVHQIAAFDLRGLIMTGGGEGKDLCDLVRIDPDCWERTPKFRGEIMP